MGKLVGGPFGQMSGKTGDLIGSSWKGIATVKRYQPKVANPQTAGQVAQRGKMANVVAFAQAILAVVIKPLWDRFQSGRSGFNAFVSRNIALFATAMPSNYATLVTSSGKMAATPISAAVVDVSSALLTVNWVNDAGSGFKLASDIAYVVFVNQTKGTVEGFQDGSTRGDIIVNMPIDNPVDVADVCHVYLSFLRADGTVVSVNSYTTVNATA